MNKTILIKSNHILFGVLIVCFFLGSYLFAWQEPSQEAPEGNVSTPLNTGSLPQSKSGRISATEFYDSNDPNYYLNPSGESKVLGNLMVGNTILKSDGSVSTNINADKLDDLNAADILAQSGGGGSFMTWGTGIEWFECGSWSLVSWLPAKGANAPACPAGWTEAYAGYGPYTYAISNANGNAIAVAEICNQKDDPWNNYGLPCSSGTYMSQCFRKCGTCRVCVK